MSKETKVEVHKGATKVANTVAKVFGAVAKQGNIITQCVTAVKSVYKGEPVPKADLSFIADNVARIRGWSAASANARKSEVRRIVEAYVTLPEAMEMYAKKSDTFTWHQAVKLARLLNSNTPRQAVAAMLAAPSAQKQTAIQVFDSAINRIVNLETRSQKIIGFRRDLAKLLDKHNLA